MAINKETTRLNETPISSISISSKKPRLSFWQIWNMSFGFMGVQFGFALQNANVSRIFESLGAAIDDLGILWLAAPATGLLVQPIIGYYSYRTWHKKGGRRRPFFAIGAILTTIALFLMPNSTALWMAAIVAFLLPILAKRTSRKMTHLIALVCGAIGLVSIYFISDPNMLLVSMIGIGIA